MARTKASVGAKVAARKSSKARCSVAPPPIPGASGTTDRSSRGSSSGNPVCPRETPNWQKPITSFFVTKNCGTSDSDDSDAEEKRKPKPKRNVIESDGEQSSPDKPKNTELEESIVLEPLTGEDSHRIEEYYSPENIAGVMAENNAAASEENNNTAVNGKGKGVGKKSRGKENSSGGSKRDRVERSASESASKRIKLDSNL